MHIDSFLFGLGLFKIPDGQLKLLDQQPVNQTRQARESAAHTVWRPQATPAHCPVVWRSSALKDVEDPRQRHGVNLCILPDGSPVAKINLDQSVPGGRHGLQPSVILR
jgi:hypothetical protein